MIMPFVNLDKNAKGREHNHYTVRSIYFDTPELHFYTEKIEGVPNRKKVRLRGYDTHEQSNGVVFTEIKRKYQIPILKNRAKMTYQDAIDLFEQKKHISDILEKSFPSLEDLYNDDLKMAMPNHFILEVKFNQYYPGWMKAIVHALNLKQVSASKYCITIDSHGFMNRSRKFKVISNAKLFKPNYAGRIIQ